ncbi:hypothetical protein [uncultured Pseudoteredinibacter sp.]|uniref:hypothetical protein n=1 Tax=uncultured Pseudoteredinibacter sp. TaxID=1641701 RepID=UPI00261D8C89|nr:hypothetical protein [uncultured Pseudoteredinibacter sp.]
MKITKSLLGTAICAGALLAGNSYASDDFPGVKKLMDENEFKQSGLDKLSEIEIKALNKWLIKYTAQDSSLIRQNVKAVQEESKTEIRSRIKGTFKGWKGNTKFYLENGQVWQQRNQKSGTRWVANMENPEVLISTNFFGLQVLTIIDKDKSTKVKRIR